MATNVPAANLRLGYREREILRGGAHGAPEARRPQGGGGASFGAGFASEPRESSDPVFTGNFEHTPTETFAGLPLWGGQLTERGKAQKAQSEQIQKFLGDYAGAVQNGSSQQDAFRSAVQGNGGPAILTQLMMHPTALRSMENLNQFLAQGQPQGPAYSQVKGADGKVYQVARDPSTGQVIGQPQDIGLPGTPAKPGADQSRHIGGLLQDKSGNYFGVERDQNGNYSARPVTLGDASRGGPGLITNQPPSEQPAAPNYLQGTPKGAAKAANSQMRPSTVPGLPDQVSDGWTKGQPTQQEQRFFASAPQAYDAMRRIEANADSINGIGRGWVATKARQYFGINGKGAQFQQDMNAIEAAAPALQGTNYKEAMNKFVATLGSESSSPTYQKGAMSLAADNLRRQTQTFADQAARYHGVLDPITEKSLEGMGVVSSGYQDRYLWNAPPLDGAKWRLNNGVALDGASLHTLAQADAAKQLRDPNDPNDILGKRFDQTMQNTIQQRASRDMQGQASSTASAIQPASPASSAAPPPPATTAAAMSADRYGTPLPAQPGAAQPGADTSMQGNGQQPPAQQNAPVQPQPTAQGAADQSGGQATSTPPGQMGDAVVPGTNPQALMAGTLAAGGALPQAAQPGQLQPGVVTTNGTVPTPPPNPLPQAPIAQNVTSAGTAPQPSSAQPVQQTAPSTAPTTQPAQPLSQEDQENRDRLMSSQFNAASGF